jgi:hypothetical protein
MVEEDPCLNCDEEDMRACVMIIETNKPDTFSVTQYVRVDGITLSCIEIKEKIVFPIKMYVYKFIKVGE